MEPNTHLGQQAELNGEGDDHQEAETQPRTLEDQVEHGCRADQPAGAGEYRSTVTNVRRWRSIGDCTSTRSDC